jgi:hypothetical protein
MALEHADQPFVEGQVRQRRLVRPGSFGYDIRGPTICILRLRPANSVLSTPKPSTPFPLPGDITIVPPNSFALAHRQYCVPHNV